MNDVKATVMMTMEPAERARLDALVEKTESANVGEVIGNALRLYEYVIAQAEAGQRTLDLDQVFESTAKG